MVDPRLSSALWRPTVNTDGDNVMVYYLAPEDKAEQAASALHAEPDYVPEPIPFEIVRKYELVGQERQGTELALVFRQGDEIQGEGADGQEGGSKKRKAGLAGYHEFHSRTTLRKKRALVRSFFLRHRLDFFPFVARRRRLWRSQGDHKLTHFVFSF